ncbi:hypothetical protein TVAG_083820 [Trichomonas vaginalis G3]|uniref:Protein kinase domain-containing protein n=1 Tax=Trichomonas vaginalis (strain ATCC PRA-98 / G3) TaxID=412133 RepID=A2DMA6_TRIV3|nr:protein kinase-like (PK-like) family [Trichomonas vaginalis G3]EAY18526.1 hypothetical protein TVAG_083820 [Trichomonas vaginalis G3]KAI5489484.1 protein kinase-like (PK-like) family [Trichomonas vaginalis G3]|eukprot:XP_001579512.1 hypothetical protein [Trichomonas vaginalis G3]
MNFESLIQAPVDTSSFNKKYGDGNNKCTIHKRKDQLFKTYKLLDHPDPESTPNSTMLRDIIPITMDHFCLPKIKSLYFAKNGYLSASMEYIEHEDVKNINGLMERLNTKTIYYIFKTLQYLHQHGVHHCDLDPLNILFKRNDDISIIDFDTYNRDGIKHTQIFIRQHDHEFSDEFALLMFSIVYLIKENSCPSQLGSKLCDYANTVIQESSKNYQLKLENLKKYEKSNNLDSNLQDISDKIHDSCEDNKNCLQYFIDAFINSIENEENHKYDRSNGSERLETLKKIINDYNRRCMNMHFISDSLKKGVFLSSFIDYAFEQSNKGDCDAMAFLGEVFLTGVVSNHGEYAKKYYPISHTYVKQRIRTAYLLIIKAMKNGSDFARDRISIGLQIMKSILESKQPNLNNQILLAQMCDAFGFHMFNFWEGDEFSEYFYEYDNTDVKELDLLEMLKNPDPEIIYDSRFKKLCTDKAKEIYEKESDYLLLMMKIRTLLLIDPTNPKISKIFNEFKTKNIFNEDFIFEMSSYYWIYKPKGYKDFEQYFNLQMLMHKRVSDPNSVLNNSIVLQADVFEHLLADYFQLF